MHHLDDTDIRLIELLRDEPHLPIAALARQAGIARNTATARIARLERSGVVVGYGPDLDPAAIGFGVMAFTTLQITQGTANLIVDHLRTIPEVLEVHAVTGGGDLMCRIVARANDHLHDVLQAMLTIEHIERTETVLVLDTPLQRSLADVSIATHRRHEPSSDRIAPTPARRDRSG